MIKNLKDIKKDELDLFGGKATNLGFLIQNNFNVPEGFCVPTNITKLTDEIKKEIQDNFIKLNSPVSVRSSATVEDLEDASFAGQFETILNVKTANEVFKAIQKCWNSVNSEGAKFYKKRKCIGDIKMAVIIQKMIDADSSGVMFTLDPINKEALLIECASGLGENIVSGKVTPSSYLIERNYLDILKENNKHKFDKNLIIDIAKLGIKIEDKYSRPQDIEFSIKKEIIYILQSRPITT